MNIETAAEMARRKREESIALPESLGELVRECAALEGERTLAVWFEDDTSITYRELDRQADCLADALMQRGVRKGCHVAVMLPNVPAFPVTWVALGRIGAVMVPVNTAYTSTELGFVLADSDAQFLIIDAAYLPVLETLEALPPLLAQERVVVHGCSAADRTDWHVLIAQGNAPFTPPTPVMRTDLLNLQYTSGTTGFPKGCMLTHDYWVIAAHNAAWHRQSSKGKFARTLIWAPFFYMDPLWQFLMTLRLGATAYIARRMSLSLFLQWLREYRIDYCVFPEPLLKQHPPSPSDAEIDLKYISIYGWIEANRREVQRRFNVVAREGYGMTEIGNATLVPAEAHEQGLLRTCGLASPFRELSIRNEDGTPVPDGEIGELWVRGRAISWGYYKRAAANAESYRGEWFRTGDLFRRDADGYYYIVGRIKEMIKRAGENVAANEVEAVLRSLPDIEEAAVLAVPDELRREEVKAYVKLASGLTPRDITPQAIAEHCATHLAAFKIPRYIQYVDDFPRTPSRKIAKKQLLADGADLLAGCYDRQENRWL